MTSEAELAYLVDGIVQGIRNDGRACEDTRPISLEFDLIPSANTSVRLRRGNDSSVLVGIKAELTTDLPHPDEGVIELSCEAGDSQIEPLFSFFLPSVDKRQLCIKEGTMGWLLYVDCLIEKSNGAILDLVSLAIKFALSTLTLPLVSVLPQVERGEVQRVNFEKLTLFDARSVPACITFGAVKEKLYLDPNQEEEWAARGAVLTACVTESGELIGIHKSGTGPIDLSVVSSVSSAVHKVGPSLFSGIREVLATRQ